MNNQVDMNWPQVEPYAEGIASIPFSPAVDVLSIAAYLNLARALVLLQTENSGYPEIHLNNDDGEILRETLAVALNWFDQMGIKERHPELKVIPTEISPCDFLEGDMGATAEWLSEKLETSMRMALKKLDYALN